MLIDTAIIRSYIIIHNTVYQLFDDKTLLHKKYYVLLGMDRHSFARKIKTRSFSLEEVLKIAEEINNQLSLKQPTTGDEPIKNR